MAQKGKMLKEGDTVLWSGGWGKETPKKVKVKAIEICEEGEKNGTEVEEVFVDGTQHFVVTLDNGHWAYAYQIELID